MKSYEKKPTFEPNEEIRVNLKFQNNNIRLNLVPMASAQKIASQGGSGAKNTEDVDSEVEKERAMVIDATCVRIMKSRKVCKHNDLIELIIKQVTMF